MLLSSTAGGAWERQVLQAPRGFPLRLVRPGEPGPVDVALVTLVPPTLGWYLGVCPMLVLLPL